MGGHAPVVGAEVYVFQAGTTGYASAPTKRMTAGAGDDPTYGFYALTQQDGSFSVTGDYTCTSGHPVYVAAVGGTASTTASIITITGASRSGTASPYTLTFTTTTPPAVGSTVSFATGVFPGTNHAFLQGTTQTVTATTANSFSISSATNPGTGSVTGYALTGGLPNPAIVNIAVLGNCPTTGNFSTGGTALSFVWIDEDSTTAAAYALNAFGTGWYAIGTKNTAANLAGIKQAAINAGQLYNIQNSTSANRGQALALTPSVISGGVQIGNNGVVPQATLNTIGNILSSCVDSANTSTTTSDPCTTLFTTATSTGDTTGTNPTDITGAAFNLAAFPAGTGTQSGTLPATLYALQGASATPFQPSLPAAPNDFGVAITYNSSLNSHVGQAESVAVDSNGQIWTTAQADTSATLWSPSGTVVGSNSSGFIYGYVSIDPNNDAWTGNATSSTGIEEFSNTAALTHTYGRGYQSAYTVITNATGNFNPDAYFFSGPTTGQTGSWYTSGGGYNGPYTGENPAVYVSHGAIDSNGNLWLTSEYQHQIAQVSPNYGFTSNPGFTSNFTIATPNPPGAAYQPQPEFPAIDKNNNAWIPIQTTLSSIANSAQTPGLYKVSNGGAVTSYYSGTGTSSTTKIYTGANFYQSFGAAIDGNGNVWITNRYNSGLGGSSTDAANSTIIELTSAGKAVSPSTNYNYGGIFNDTLNLAIDPSGDIWVTNYTGSQLVEIIGAAAPVVTPLSSAANNGDLGQQP
jgi:hypothetical protein